MYSYTQEFWVIQFQEENKSFQYLLFSMPPLHSEAEGTGIL